ncbi:MAG: type II secretion system protein GspE [Candidatus Abyssobacteria bacterium SURF_17]|uniref:protein-secreting ATPase n=1 Tax=Candidatus Abyssobacteria bacterium SURF_17 TaxID=2093361 RepID=A0A419EMZ2_9BACT|nr:MAG: type II secretion system protein GspE [Candidatus Abyssubacteria bacterium SURF_17]
MPLGTRNLGEILLENGVITAAQLEEALEKQRVTREFLGRTLVSMGYATEQDIVNALGIQQGMEQANLGQASIDPDVLNLVTPDIAQFYNIIPIRKTDNILTIAMADPLAINTIDDLKVILGCEIEGAVSTQSEIAAAIERHYGYQKESAAAMIDELFADVEKVIDNATVKGSREEIADANNLIAIAHEAPVIKLINLVILQAIQSRASDLHFEPFEEDYQVRQRVDGVLYTIATPPKHLSIAVSSRLKVMSNLDIAERRLPQDGRIQLSLGGKDIDLRISFLPTMFGESVVIRILDRSAVMIALEGLGLEENQLTVVADLIQRPSGIILVTGPTGSGKTTTLYACLNELNSPEWKIITTEDPVEYQVNGIVQVNINEKVGLTFAKCLRSILRQDPDICMVGEIRDIETAALAVEASLTGHLVFSTLHTNDAPSTITRLIDMDIEPFLITSTIEAIVAQRLVRKLCLFCREEYEPTQEELDTIGLTKEQLEGHKIYRARGCKECSHIGYKGRTGIYELMTLNDETRDLVLQRSATGEIRDAAIRAGMRSLREAGIRKILAGITTIEEVVGETMGYA